MSNPINAPEYTIRQALVNGFTYYSADGKIAKVEALLQGYPASVIEATKKFIKTWSADKNIVMGYPRTGASFPLIAIVLQSDEDEDGYLGDLGEVDDDQTVWLAAKPSGTFGIGIFTDNGDLTSSLYRIVKFMFRSQRKFLESNNVLNARYSGADLEPNAEYLPEHVYARFIMLHCDFAEMLEAPDELYQTVEAYNAVATSIEENEDGTVDVQIGNFEITEG